MNREESEYMRSLCELASPKAVAAQPLQRHGAGRAEVEVLSNRFAESFPFPVDSEKQRAEIFQTEEQRHVFWSCRNEWR